MNHLANLAEQIMNKGVELIFSPTYKLLKIFFIFFVIGAFLFALTFSPLVIIALPMLLYFFYLYYLFSKIWCSYKFSTLYLVLLLILAFVSGVVIKIFCFEFGG